VPNKIHLTIEFKPHKGTKQDDTWAWMERVGKGEYIMSIDNSRSVLEQIKKFMHEIGHIIVYEFMGNKLNKKRDEGYCKKIEKAIVRPTKWALGVK